MSYLEWRAQYRREAVYAYHTSRYFAATAFPDYHCVSINILTDAWRDLLNLRMRKLERYQ